MSDIFSASFAKVDRARQFISELVEFAQAYRSSEPAAGYIAMVDGVPQLQIELRAVGLVPGCIVGDTVHNLRTALDLMASELSGNSKNVYFPFSDSEEGLPDMIKRKNFSRCGPDAVQLLEKYRPYHGGNVVLRALHDFDIEDKHKALIVTPHTARINFNTTYSIDDPTSGTISINVENIEFRLLDDSPLGAVPVLQALEDFVELVVGILEAFTGLVAARQ